MDQQGSSLLSGGSYYSWQAHRAGVLQILKRRSHMLNGCVCRVCVSDDPLEVVRMLGFANDYLATLAQNRLLQLKEQDGDGNG